MDLQLDGKLALVSGSTAGIGFAIARTLAQEGASVIVNGRSQAAVDEAVERIRSETQGTVLGHAGDLSRADAAEFAEMGKTPLPMPMLVLSGEKAGGTFLVEQGKMVATNVQGVIVKGSGHWLMEEAPDQVIPALITFLG